MKNNRLSLIPFIILIIIFIVFNVVAFVIPFEKQVTFWVCYSFTVVAFVLQLITLIINIRQKMMDKNTFLRIPSIYISLIYCSVQIALFFVLCILNATLWVTITILIIVFGVTMVLLLLVKLGKIYINSNDEYSSGYTTFLSQAQEIINARLNEEPNSFNTKLESFNEMIRFSDPISNGSVVDIEKEIIAILSKELSDNSLERAINLLNKRNFILKQEK